MRLKLATSLKNKTSSLARDPRLLNSVVDTKGRVQKRPSLVASFGPVTVGNGLGLFVRNTPIGTTGGTQELIAITGTIVTIAPAAFGAYTLIAGDTGGGIFGYQINNIGSITPTTFNGQTINEFMTLVDTITTVKMSGNLSQDFWIRIVANAVTLLSANATTFEPAPSESLWNFSAINVFTATGTYPVTIV